MIVWHKVGLEIQSTRLIVRYSKQMGISCPIDRPNRVTEGATRPLIQKPGRETNGCSGDNSTEAMPSKTVAGAPLQPRRTIAEITGFVNNLKFENVLS